MRGFLKNYRICIIIAVIAAVVTGGAYFYNDFYRESSVTTTVPVYSIKKVNKYNSMVPGIFILNEGRNKYDSIGSIFSSLGYDIMEGKFEEYKRIESDKFIFIVPSEEAARLTDENNKYIIEEIKEGRRIITWGKSSLSKELGIRFLGNKKIQSYLWSSQPDTAINLKNTISFESFSFKSEMKVLASYKENKPLIVSGKLDKGSFIYSGISLASSNGASYEQVPFIMEAIEEEFNIRPSLARDDLALYVDLDFHLEEAPAAIAERLKKYGVDQINLSAWYPVEEQGKFYSDIIDECHKRGILVYAWFEFPFVSIDFWNKHPEWREKTASGKDAKIDWRYLMALDNPEALEEIKKYTKEFMTSFDWDGIDIAEIYFESPGEGFKEEDKFTPMNESFRKSFEQRYGVDPIKAFDAASSYHWSRNNEMKQNLIDYRVELVNKLHEEFLVLAEELRKERPYLKTSVTVIDSIADKNMRERIGVDAKDIAKLQDKYHFMLQIEDPYTLWNLGPERYKVIGEEYRFIMSPENLLSIDINIINRMGEVYPTSKQRGLETYELISNASKHTDKVILYALGTVEDSDMEFAPYTRGSDITVEESAINEYIIKSNKRFIWETDTEGKVYYVDGEQWPFYSEKGVIIPGGEHSLKIESKSEASSKLRIEGINAEIMDVVSAKDIIFSYSSDGRFFMIMNKKPREVSLDGILVKVEVKEVDGKYTMTLPEGRHKVIISE
jgi:hypothetical protein